MYTALGILFVLVCLPGIRWVVRAVSSDSSVVNDAVPEFESSNFSRRYVADRLPEENAKHDQRWNKRFVTEVYDQEKAK